MLLLAKHQKTIGLRGVYLEPWVSKLLRAVIKKATKEYRLTGTIAASYIVSARLSD